LGVQNLWETYLGQELLEWFSSRFFRRTLRPAFKETESGCFDAEIAFEDIYIAVHHGLLLSIAVGEKVGWV
jgi:hypothetical protein